MSNVTGHPQLETVILLMVSGQTQAELTASCGKLGIPADQVAAITAEARRRLTVAATTNRDEELGKAYARLNDLYTRSLKGSDFKTSLQAQRELNKLLDLYGAKTPLGGSSGGETTGPEAAELAAIRAHLMPLALAAESYPLREHARIAADTIRELRERSD